MSRKRGVTAAIGICSFFFVLCVNVNFGIAQQPTSNQTVYVDEEGVLRYQGSGKEAAFFGVNYSPPFAHSYRAINRLGKDHKQVIDQDAYHFARLGFDAFRIHIWDTEISDSLGNVVSNEHLDLLDYMLAKLKQRGIKVILTPLTFYNNGYPEPPTETDGFANYISKEEAPQKQQYWPIIRRYLKQFLNHRNPYTGLTYKEDPNIIAAEIVNEPAHGGSQDSVTSYVNMLADHIRSMGWEKPVFYNISQNPSMAEGVMNADIDGTSFQWYPGGLVGGEAIQKNYLPYVDKYAIPFAGKKAFQNKAQMVYEFSSADFMGSYIYPAMARSFREAGFQWATQFAYDPMAMAHVNTDYRTHYLNLAYTPAKAISMKIASAAFHQLPRNKSYGRYPRNNLFGNFKVSHNQNLSLLNADTAFFYTNDTEIAPRDPQSLKHVAGVGSSPVVSYKGTGAYFLDKVEDGVWRLEVMPDAVAARDPFAVVALDKRLTWIEWKQHSMNIDLPELGDQFRIQGVNAENDKKLTSNEGGFSITPGTYLLISDEKKRINIAKDQKLGNYRLNEFVAPEPTKNKPIVRHEPKSSVVAGEAVNILATIAGLKPNDEVILLVQSGWQPQEIKMKKVNPYKFEGEIPAKMITNGYLTYWITIDRGEKTITFPGGHKGQPSQWDYYHEERWQTPVLDGSAPIELFSAAEDLQDIDYAFSFWEHENSMEITSTKAPGAMAIRISPEGQLEGDRQAVGWKTYVGDEMASRSSSVDLSDYLVVKARGGGDPQTLQAIAVERDGTSYSANISLSGHYDEHRISFSSFHPDSMMLLPRPYPTFLPLWFKAEGADHFNPANIEELQFVIPTQNSSGKKSHQFEIESAWIEQGNN